MKTMKEALWVPIDDVLDHPVNPRALTNYEIDNLVNIIRKHGFLVPLTVVRHEKSKYMITSGHRRKEAAIKAGMKEIPIFIKEPTDEEGVLDLLLNGQLDHENFTPYEWGYFLWSCWRDDGCPPISDQMMETVYVVGKLTDKGELRTVFYAFEHIPEHIWQKVRDEKLSFGSVKDLARWVRTLEEYKPHIIDEYGLKYVIESLFAKMERGLIKKNDLKISSIPRVAPDEALVSLITKTDISLGKLLEDLGYRNENTYRRTRNARNALSKTKSILDNLQPQDAQETEEAIRLLRLALSEVRKNKSRIQNMGIGKPKDANFGEVSEQVKDIVFSYKNDRGGFTAREINLEMLEYKISSIDSYLRKLVKNGYLTVASDVKPRRYFVSEEWKR